MSTRILVGHEQGSDRDIACYFCSTTGTVFGPVFRGNGFDGPEEEAEAFETWLSDKPPRLMTQGYTRRPMGDPRIYMNGELTDLYSRFRREVESELKDGART